MIKTNSGSGATRKVGVQSSTGNECIVYFPNNSTAIIRNILALAATSVWFDPRNGEIVDAELFDTGQERSMTVPSGWEDALLVISVGR